MKIVVMMSGGVDSSVCAALLKNQGHEVIGVTMRLSEANDCTADAGSSKTCCGISEAMLAREVCKILGIKHIYKDFSKQFKTKVIDKFIQSYNDGLTPVPCSDCNDYIKFGDCLEYAINELGADYVATGHYAQIIDGQLHKSQNTNKDQSYFLAGVNRNYINKILFPIANLEKEEVRQIARDYNLPVANKRESMDICFAPNGYREFLQNNNVQIKNGPIYQDGVKIGEHSGTQNYTYGQKLKGQFVTKIRAGDNIIEIGSRPKSKTVTLTEINYLVSTLPQKTFKIRVRNRCEYDCRVVYHDHNMLILESETDMLNLTPGQSGVLYSDSLVLLKGTIVK